MAGTQPRTEVRPQELPWTLLAPAGSAVIEVRDRGVRLPDQLRGLPSGAPVLLLDGRPGGRRRLRRLARRSGLQVERECLVLPSLRSGLFLADDAPVTVSWLCRSVLTVPPGMTLAALPVDLAIRALRRLAPWWLLGLAVPGRAVLGRVR